MVNLGLRYLRPLLLVTLSTMQLEATEKYWVAREAEFIVVGTFHKQFEFPWFDGWRVTGSIQIEQTLYGNGLPERLNANSVCECCEGRRRWWPGPSKIYPEPFSERGV